MKCAAKWTKTTMVGMLHGVTMWLAEYNWNTSNVKNVKEIVTCSSQTFVVITWFFSSCEYTQQTTVLYTGAGFKTDCALAVG